MGKDLLRYRNNGQTISFGDINEALGFARVTLRTIGSNNGIAYQALSYRLASTPYIYRTTPKMSHWYNYYERAIAWRGVGEICDVTVIEPTTTTTTTAAPGTTTTTAAPGTTTTTTISPTTITITVGTTGGTYPSWGYGRQTITENLWFGSITPYSTVPLLKNGRILTLFHVNSWVFFYIVGVPESTPPTDWNSITIGGNTFYRNSVDTFGPTWDGQNGTWSFLFTSTNIFGTTVGVQKTVVIT